MPVARADSVAASLVALLSVKNGGSDATRLIGQHTRESRPVKRLIGRIETIWNLVNDLNTWSTLSRTWLTRVPSSNSQQSGSSNSEV